MARKDLPSPNAPNFLARVREEVHALLGKLGSGSDRALTLRDAIESGVIVPGPGGSLIPGPGAGAAEEPDLTPPPQPGAFTAIGAISHFMISQAQPFYTQGHGHSRTVVYGAQWVSGPLPVFADAVELDRFAGTVRAIASNPATTWHLWIKWESNDGVLSATPAGGTNGLAVTTGQDVALLLDALAGQITSTELASSLSTPIGKIPALESGLAQEIIDRAQAIANEASDRAAAIQAAADAAAAGLAAEIGNRVAAIQQVDMDLRNELATADAVVVSSLTSAFQSADAATLASANSYTFSKTEINTAISAMGTQLTTNFSAADAATLATAQNFTYSRSAIDAADAATLSTLRSEFAAADSTTLATAQNFTYSRSTIDGAIASSASTLRSQLTGGSTATDLNLLSSGLLYQMRETSAAQDAALSQQITLLSAGAGEQFDYSNIWYFDSGAESWTANGTGSTLSAVSGWLRLVSNSGALTDRYFISPDNLGVNGAKYPQVRLRLRKVGNPTWEGALYFITTTDATYNGAKSATIDQPAYDANGIGLVTFNMPASWTGATIRQIRFDASTTITPTDYFELDWVAVGRPSPGASSAQLTAEQVARMEGDDANAQNIIALNAALAGKADASALNALETRVTSAEGVNTSQGSSITSLQNSVTTINGALGTKADASALAELTTRVTAAEGVNTSQGSSITSLSNSLTTVDGLLRVNDTRNDNRDPNWYVTNYPQRSVVEFKFRTVIGAPGSASYGDLRTTVRWQDLSGGPVTQVFSPGDSLQSYSRFSTSGTTWSAWKNDVLDLTTVVGTKANASALNALDTRVTTAEGTISSQGSSITTLQNDLSTLTGTVGTKASASALSALDARVTSAEGVNTSQATAITGLQSSVTTLSNGLAAKADANALTTTNTNVSNLSGTVSAQAGQITTLQSRVSRVVNYLIRSAGSSSQASTYPGVFSETGAALTAGVRSYVLVVFNGSTGAIESAVHYDVFGNGDVSEGRNSASMAAAMNALGADKVVAVYTWDEPRGNRLTGGLPEAMYRCGASRSIFGAPDSVFRYRSAYILVGIPGIGEGAGIERYAGSVDDDPLAYCEYSLQLVNGRPVGMGGNPLNATVQTEISTRASQTGELYAQYTVKTDVGGLVSGYGLASQATNGDPVTLTPGLYDVAPERILSIQRASTATYIDDAGLLQTAAANVARYQGGLMLVEGEATNLLVAFPALSNMTAGHTGVVDDVEMHAGFVRSVYFAAGGSARYAYQSAAVTPSSVYTLSVYVVIAGGIPVAADFSAGSDFLLTIFSNVSPAAIEHVIGNLYRARVTAAAPVSPGGNFGVVKYAAQSARPFWVMGYQLERSDQPSSLVTSSTRAADIITIINPSITSAFGVQAGKFFVAPPAVAAATAPTAGLFKGYAWRDTTANVTKYWTGSAWSTSPQALPFVVQTVPQTINGVEVPPGVYMDSAYMRTFVAQAGQIGALAVDDAAIASVSASKITAGSIAVGQYIQSTGIYPGDGTPNFRVDGNGLAVLNQAVVRGIVYASGGEFTGTVRGATIIGGTLTTAESGQRVKIDEQGILFLTGASNGKYGSFKYGAKKYGDGVLVYFNNSIKRVPFYVNSEQDVADIHLYNRAANPPAGEPGDIICVNSRLKTWDAVEGRWRTLAFSD